MKKEKASLELNNIRIYYGEHLLYRGPLSNVPIREASIIEKSIEFFDDPEPCYIHRGAVKARILSELERCFTGDTLDLQTSQIPFGLLECLAL